MNTTCGNRYFHRHPFLHHRCVQHCLTYYYCYCHCYKSLLVDDLHFSVCSWIPPTRQLCRHTGTIIIYLYCVIPPTSYYLRSFQIPARRWNFISLTPYARAPFTPAIVWHHVTPPHLEGYQSNIRSSPCLAILDTRSNLDNFPADHKSLNLVHRSTILLLYSQTE